MNPTLYNEERHLLFIYPPVFLLGLLGLHPLSSCLKYTLAAVLFVTTIATYVHWGQYAYMYQSPIIGQGNSFTFMGDYKNLCYARGVDFLVNIAPSPSVVAVDGWTVNLAKIQYDRLRLSPVMKSRVANLPQLDFTAWRPRTLPFYVIAANRLHSKFFVVQREIREGKAELIWSERFPTGDLGCIIAKYSTD